MKYDVPADTTNDLIWKPSGFSSCPLSFDCYLIFLIVLISKNVSSICPPSGPETIQSFTIYQSGSVEPN